MMCNLRSFECQPDYSFESKDTAALADHVGATAQIIILIHSEWLPKSVTAGEITDKMQ